MPPQDDKSYIDELKKTLYSRTAPDVRTKRKLRFTAPSSGVKTDWEHPSEEDVRPKQLNTEYEDHSMSFFTKLVIISAVFCVIAVGIGAYLFFNGSNLISANNISIVISGPVSIPGGVPETFDITIQNKNNVALQLADMSVSFPTGATDPTNPGTPLTNSRKMIGDIPAGGTSHQSVSAIIFGEENLQKEIGVTLTYSVKGTTAVFTKTQSYDVLINSSPINVTVSSFKEISSGQEFDIKVDLKSNSQQVLRNVLLKADYPFGYSFLSSSLPALSGNASWKIGDIPAGGDRAVTIHGKLTGENSDLRAFHFTVGAIDPKDSKNIGTEYMAVEQDMTIQKPFISLDIAIDNDTASANHIGQFDSPEHVEIDWSNNLSVPISNLTITAKLTGSAYNKSDVEAGQGVFDSLNNQIVWNQQTNGEFGSVAAGDSGNVIFTITPKDLGVPNKQIVNPNLTFDVSVMGNRAQESNVTGVLSSAVTKNVRISSNVSLSGRVTRTVGPFVNTGPIPPKSEQATTYTIIWDVDNTANAVGNAEVTAALPAYVKWLKATSPAAEDVSYDGNSGIVTWNIGNVGTYTLSSSRRREAAFQVSITPSVTQVGQTPVLVNKSTLTATDNFTGTQLQSQQDNLTTRFSTDPAYQDGNEIVVH